MSTPLFLTAFYLGFLFNAAPGAIFAESLRRGIKGGFMPAFAVQIGSLLGDFTWAVLGLAGVAVLFALPYVDTPLALIGAALLFWLAWQSWCDAFSPVPEFDPHAQNQGEALAVGAALSLSNPMNITYWAALGGTLTAFGIANPGWQDFAIFLAGFMASSVLWCFICAGGIAWSRQYVGPNLWFGINLVCAVGLAFLAGVVVWNTTVS